MPRPKSLDRYPQSYFDLFERAYAGSVSIPTASPSAAANLRSELYTFRRVLRNSVTEGLEKRQIALMADDLQFRVEGKNLIVEKRNIARSRLIERVLDAADMEELIDKATEGTTIQQFAEKHL